MQGAGPPDGQFTHICDAGFARRANLPHLPTLAPSSGKSKASSSASRLDEEGRYGRSSRNVRRGAMDAAASARRDRRAVFTVSGNRARKTNGAEAYGEVLWSWHPLLMPSRVEACRPNRVSDAPFNPRGDGGKKELVTGEITYKPQKPLRGECRMFPVPPL
jgi:hypothetical protein